MEGNVTRTKRERPALPQGRLETPAHSSNHSKRRKTAENVESLSDTRKDESGADRRDAIHLAEAFMSAKVAESITDEASNTMAEKFAARQAASVPNWMRQAFFVSADVRLPLPDASVTEDSLSNKRDLCQLLPFVIDWSLIQSLHRMGITSFLPVQAAVLKVLLPPPPLRTAAHCSLSSSIANRATSMVSELPSSTPPTLRSVVNASSILPIAYVGRDRDVCVCSPTGSGKTLAYLLPILSALAGKAVRRLRALVVVPNRDLAMQVHSVCTRLARPLKLRTACLVGQRALEADLEDLFSATLSQSHEIVRSYLTGSRESSTNSHFACDFSTEEPDVDVVTCTPGRLTDHIHLTPGFVKGLRHLRFLVMDEVDKLMGDSGRGWLRDVIRAFERERSTLSAGRRSKEADASPKLQKLLFSATFGRNPQQLAELELRNPLYVTLKSDVDGRKSASQIASPMKPTTQEDEFKRSELLSRDGLKYRLPDELKQSFVVCDDKERPLVVFHVVERFLRGESLGASLAHSQISSTMKIRASNPEANSRKSRILVFTSSIEATHRLSRLISLLSFAQIPVAELSSSLSQTNRNRVLSAFRHDRAGGRNVVQVLVCTDAAARGLDFPAVDCVINYGFPASPLTYVHRVGRTARAGCAGIAISVVPSRQVRFMKVSLKRITQNSSIAELALPRDWLALPQTSCDDASPRGAAEQVTKRQSGNRSGVSAERERSESLFPLLLPSEFAYANSHFSLAQRFRNALQALNHLLDAETRGVVKPLMPVEQLIGTERDRSRRTEKEDTVAAALTQILQRDRSRDGLSGEGEEEADEITDGGDRNGGSVEGDDVSRYSGAGETYDNGENEDKEDSGDELEDVLDE